MAHFIAPTPHMESDPAFVYHATNEENMYAIVESGSMVPHGPSYGTDQSEWPDGSRQKRSYFSGNASVVYAFAPEEGHSVILRIPRAAADFRAERSTGDLYTTARIAAHHIEILTSEGWAQLGAV